jgi:DNA-directed RNA polymerase subunit RPC12/RpoP
MIYYHSKVDKGCQQEHSTKGEEAMPEGRCPKCGASFAGWALTKDRYQTCPKCGILLEVTEDIVGSAKAIISQFSDEHVTDANPDNQRSSGK